MARALDRDQGRICSNAIQSSVVLSGSGSSGRNQEPRSGFFCPTSRRCADGLDGDRPCFLDHAVPGITLHPANARLSTAGSRSLRVRAPTGAPRRTTTEATGPRTPRFRVRPPAGRFSLLIDSSSDRQSGRLGSGLVRVRESPGTSRRDRHVCRPGKGRRSLAKSAECVQSDFRPRRL